MPLLLRKDLTKAHDVTGEARVPAGGTGGGRWTTGGGTPTPGDLATLRDDPRSQDRLVIKVQGGVPARPRALKVAARDRMEIARVDGDGTVWVTRGRGESGIARDSWGAFCDQLVDPDLIGLAPREATPATPGEGEAPGLPPAIQRLHDHPDLGDSFRVDARLRLNCGLNSLPEDVWSVREPPDIGGAVVVSPYGLARKRRVTIPKGTWDYLFATYGDRISLPYTDPPAPATPPAPDPADIPQFEDTDRQARAADSARRAVALTVGSWDDASKWKKVGGSGKSKPYLAKLDGRQVLVSPEANQRPGISRRGIAPGSELRRAVAACLINRAMGCPVEMPEAIVRDTPKGRALVQEFVGDTAGTVMVAGWDYIHNEWGKRSPAKALPSNEALNMATFDGVSGNLDRHWNNALIRPDRVQPSMEGDDGPHALVSIDHGLCLPLPVPNYLKPNCNLLMQQFVREQMLGMDTDQWQSLLALERNHVWLDGKLDALEIEPGAVEEMWRRADYMRDGGEIITDRDMEDRPWGGDE